MTTKDKVKPVAWRIFRGGRWTYSDAPSKSQEDRAAWQPIYAATKIKWHGLTDEEAAQCWNTSAVQTWKNIEAKLKEKNGC